MTEIQLTLDTMRSGVFFANPYDVQYAFPSVAFGGEEVPLLGYPTQIIDRMNNLTAERWREVSITTTDPAKLELGHGTDTLAELRENGVFSLFRATKVEGSVDQVLRMLAAHPLGKLALAESEEEFDQHALDATKPGYYLHGASWMEQDEQNRAAFYEVSHLVGVPSYILGNTVCIRSDQTVAIMPDSHRQGGMHYRPHVREPGAVYPPHRGNVVLPPVDVDITYQAESSGGLKTNYRFGDAYMLLPRSYVPAKVPPPQRRADYYDGPGWEGAEQT